MSNSSLLLICRNELVIQCKDHFVGSFKYTVTTYDHIFTIGRWISYIQASIMVILWCGGVVWWALRMCVWSVDHKNENVCYACCSKRYWQNHIVSTSSCIKFREFFKMMVLSLKRLLFILLNSRWNTSLTCQFVLNC